MESGFGSFGGVMELLENIEGAGGSSGASLSFEESEVRQVGINGWCGFRFGKEVKRSY